MIARKEIEAALTEFRTDMQVLVEDFQQKHGIIPVIHQEFNHELGCQLPAGCMITITDAKVTGVRKK